MSVSGLLAVFIGAGFGASLRWLFGLWLNPLWQPIPLGTVAANLLGGFLIGVSLALFEHHPGLPPEWRLLTVTGFLGGLTTFSTFSAEVVTLLARGDLLWGCTAAAVHLGGSLLLTALGLGIYRWLAI